MSDEPIISTKDRPGSYDAIETAKPGEPLFPIQGGDPFGPATVLFWVDLCRAAGRDETDPKKAAHLLNKATDAELVAWAMQAYQRGDVAIEGQRAQYNDAAPAASIPSDQGRPERETRIRAVGRLHNMIAGANEIVAQLAALRACPEQEVEIREAVELLTRAALAIEPRRGNERT